MTEPRFHVPIDKQDTVTSSSHGLVSKTNWDANAGLHRQQQIEAARKEAWEAHYAQKGASIEDRLDILELKLQALEREVLRGEK